MRELMFAISSTAFAAIFLISVIVLGAPVARSVAILAALVACISQFAAQDAASYRVSIYSAYFAFALAIFAFVAFVLGR